MQIGPSKGAASDRTRHMFTIAGMDFQDIRSIKLPGKSNIIFDSDFHPEKDNVLVVGTIKGDVHILRTDAKDDPFLTSLRRHHKGTPVRQVEFSGSNLLVSAAKMIKLYDLDASKTIQKIENSTDPGRPSIYAMKVVDNFLLCTGDDDGYFRLWDYRTSRGVAMELRESEEYISDLVVTPEGRTVLATSGEGTLTSFNIRAKKMELQSELLSSALTCLRVLESKGKVIVGSEGGAIEIFNLGQYGNISDRYPISSKTSIDKIEVISGTVVAVGLSEERRGHTKIINLFPHKTYQDVFTHDSGSVETISVQESTNIIASSSGNVIHLATFKDMEESEDGEEVDGDGDATSSSDSESDPEPQPKKRQKTRNVQPSNDFFSDL